MAKAKFYFNTKTLKYEKVQLRFWDVVKKAFTYISLSAVFAAVTIIIAYKYFDSPAEKKLKRDNMELAYRYEVLNGKLGHIERVLSDLQDRDDNIYRMILEAEPISENIRKAGFGGVDRYKELEGFENSELMVNTTKKMDMISKQLYIQSKSFDDVVKMAKNKATMLAAIPAIQPISNKDLRRLASGYGYRTHPIYKTRHMHTGIDFTAAIGTEIYTTGDGIVERADAMASGYGNHVVIDHGFGYKTLYGHMVRWAVRQGQRVKRGDVIGYVGNTGLSTAPHLHYEVIKGNNKINPINYFYNDLSAEEFAQMLDISSKSTQTFD